MDRKIVLENGMEFYGSGFGCRCERLGWAQFNTSMVGTGGVLYDSANTDCLVVMTYPLIGNCGLALPLPEKKPLVAGLVVREASEIPNNFRAAAPLDGALRELGTPGIQGVDTRRLTRAIRENGEMRAILTDAAEPVEAALEKLKGWAPEGRAKRAGTAETLRYRVSGARLNTVAIDLGMSQGLTDALLGYGCNLTVLPCAAAAAEVLALHPDALVIAGGAETESELRSLAVRLRPLLGRLPVLGLEAGHLAAALLAGGEIAPMKVGHHGCNHAAQNAETGKTEIIVQNHSLEADAASCKVAGIDVLYVNKLDGTPEALKKPGSRLITYHFTPELSGNCDDKVKHFIDAACSKEAF